MVIVDRCWPGQSVPLAVPCFGLPRRTGGKGRGACSGCVRVTLPPKSTVDC